MAFPGCGVLQFGSSCSAPSDITGMQLLQEQGLGMGRRCWRMDLMVHFYNKNR